MRAISENLSALRSSAPSPLRRCGLLAFTRGTCSGSHVGQGSSFFTRRTVTPRSYEGGRGHRPRGGAPARAVRRIELQRRKKGPGGRKCPGHGDRLKLWGGSIGPPGNFIAAWSKYRDAWWSATRAPYAGMYAHDNMNSVTSAEWITIHLPSEVKVMAALHPIGMTGMYQVNAASRVIWVTGNQNFGSLSSGYRCAREPASGVLAQASESAR